MPRQLLAVSAILASGMIAALETDQRLIKAVATGKLKAVREAIKSGADLNAKDKYGRDALRYAQAHPKISAYLLEKGMKPDARTLCSAATHGTYESTRLLFENGAELDGSAFACVAFRHRPGITKILQLFLENGGQRYINYITSEGTVWDVGLMHTNDPVYFETVRKYGGKRLKDLKK